MTPGSTVAIEVKGLCKKFHRRSKPPVVVLDGVSFKVNAGEIVGVFGPSGCGKSTLLRILCGVLEPDAGEIRILGKTLSTRRGAAAYVPQGNELLPWRTLLENALLGWSIRSGQRPNEAANNRAKELLGLFGIADMADWYPPGCSGGERKRTALVRALLTPAQILALDEPTAAIDRVTRAGIYDALCAFVEGVGTNGLSATALIVSHDPEELLLLCDRVLVMCQRPSRVKGIVDVTIRRPRHHDDMFSRECTKLERQLWELLRRP